ncbi:MAG: ribose ABC transporter permease [Bacillota bacterium]|nr:ribose ABC transporter permease [Bacillota bacterium]
MTKKTKLILMKYKSFIGLIIFSLIIAMLNDRFLTLGNMLNVFRQTSINSVIAAGMTYIILTGGIDLSVGSTLALTGAVAASLLSSGVPLIIAIIIAISLGAFIGFLNGLIISKGEVQPFIATLAMMTIIRGVTLIFTNGRPISTGDTISAESFSFLGSGRLFGIPAPIYLTIVVFALAYYVLKHTSLGRYIYALGGNEEATRLSGINVDKIKYKAYAISGALAAVAGLIVTARLSSAQPQAGAGYELDAIAAVVLGGTSLAGGKGGVIGTIVGALIIGILNNSLNLMDVSSYYQLLLKGIVILIAVLIDRESE